MSASVTVMNDASASDGGTYWVTGGGSGIGEALALRLARAGNRVLISGRNEEALRRVAKACPEQLIPLPCDVSDDAQMARLFADSAPQIRSLDGIILAAGVCEYIDLPDLDVASIRRVTEVNYFGVVNSCAAALPLLRRARQTRPASRPFIAGISSMSTYVGFTRAEAYGSAKAAMAYFLNSLRCDVQEEVDVSIIYPGFVKTPMTDQNDFAMPTMVSVDYAADYVLRKLAKRSRNIRFPWRLHMMLGMARLFQGLWYGTLVPRLRRKGNSKESRQG